MSSAERASGRRGCVVLLATLDTKRDEAAFLERELEKREVPVLVVDVAPRRHDAEAGSAPADAIAAAADVAHRRLLDLVSTGSVLAVAALGGGKGTALACQAMQGLPYELPKVLVSAARPDMFGPALGTSNIWILPSLVDLNGLNAYTRTLLTQAAAAIAGVVTAGLGASEPREAAVAITSFGATTPAVAHCRDRLEHQGLETVAIPATGAGGRLLEQLAGRRCFAAILDLTTTELADELAGGFASAGPNRLRAAGEAGIPQVVAPGAMDMVNFGAPETVPARYRTRQLLAHATHTTLMRTTPDENYELGRLVAERLAAARGPAALVVPLEGFSAYDRPGGQFHAPAATAAFVQGVRSRPLPASVHYEELECHINDPEFADRATEIAVQQLHEVSGETRR